MGAKKYVSQTDLYHLANLFDKLKSENGTRSRSQVLIAEESQSGELRHPFW